MEENLKQKIIQANIELHQKEAAYYDRIHKEIFNRSEQRLIRKALNLALRAIKSENVKALDIGTGTGNIALKLLDEKRIQSIIGIDLSKEMLEQLRIKIGENPKIELVNMDADLFLKANLEKFDLITVSSVLHHLPNYIASLDKIFSALAGGGVLAIFHEPTGEKSRFLDLLEWLSIRLYVNLTLPLSIRRLVKELNYDLADYQIERGMSLLEIKKYFGSRKDLEIIYQNRHNVFQFWIFRLVGKLLPTKNSFILLAKKK
jgi:ubiquinone/menaquinone biosynthesis C-methylase UbiE